MLELVHKFNQKSTASDWKGKSTAKVPFKLFWGHIYMNEHQPQLLNSLLTHASVDQ